MANVKFKRIQNSSTIGNLDIEDGSFIVTGDGKSYIDYGTSRVPTNGTLDTAMSNSSTNAVENKIIKNYVDTEIENAKDTLKPTVLYSSSSGSGSNISLSDNVDNYDYLEILYMRIEGQSSSVKLNVSITKKATLTSTYYTSGSFYIDCKNITLNGTTLIVNSNYVMYSNGTTTSIANVNNIRIYEVLGYK